MKLIPGSKFTYSRLSRPMPQSFGTRSWTKHKQSSEGLVEGEQYVIRSLRRDRGSGFIYTLEDSAGNTFEKVFPSVEKAEETFNV